MPGNLAHISPSTEAQNDLNHAIGSIPFVWDQRNFSIGLPIGYNGTTLFSTLERATQGNVLYEDPYARRTVVQCGSVANSPLNRFNVTFYPGLEIEFQLQFPLSHATTLMYSTNGARIFSDGVCGGEKESMDAPVHCAVNDLLIYLPHHQSGADPQSYSMGTIALAYVSLRPDAFQFNSLGGDIPFVVKTQQFPVSSSFMNSTSEEPVNLPVELLDVKLYIWPILCSLSVHNVTALVRSDGDTRLERTNFNMTSVNSTMPHIKSLVPSDPMVTSWSYIVDLLFLNQIDGANGDMMHLGTPPWLEQSLNQTWSLTSLEDRLSNFAAFYYAFLVQHWRTNGDLTHSQWWSEATGSVVGTRLALSGRLDLNLPQWILGCICFITMIIASAVSMLGLRIQQGPVMDGSVMDMISLLRGSSLPGIIAGDDDEDLGRDARRHRAERTMVMYKNWTLDVPERFDSEPHERTGLQSSARMITPAEELDYINSGDYEATAVDLESSMRTITLAERLEDEALPISSEGHGTTGSRSSPVTITPLEQPGESMFFNSGEHETAGLRSSPLTMTQPEQLGECLLFNSGEHETAVVDSQNPMQTIAFPEQPEYEHLPMNSEDGGTTGIQSPLRTIEQTSSGNSVHSG